MSYEKLTIKQVIEKIGNNEIYLPAIQRKFVWKQEQTEKLFDSIQQGYPIGTFLFWFVKRPSIDDYVFYKFLQNYHQRDNFLNVRIPNPELKDEIIGVLDGQQRLSSIYLALQGTYASKKPYARSDDDVAYQTKVLHLNLLSDVHLEEDNEYNYSYRFIADEEAQQRTPEALWFKVKDVLNWDKDSPPIDEFYDDLKGANTGNQEVLDVLDIPDNRNRIKRLVRDLHSRLVREELINYFKIDEQSLDNILKIFVRVNSGGTILSKTDLFFSTIVASWENGRDEIETFINTINKIGDGFNFNNDFIMRNCLMLTDCDVLFRVGSFKTENVLKIKNNWHRIKQAILTTVELLNEFGFNGYTLASQNSVMPIAYYVMKGGILDLKAKSELRKYIIHALLKNIFSSSGDTVLSSFRNKLRTKKENSHEYTLAENKFMFETIASTKLPANKSLKITTEDLNEFLNYKKGTNTFLILTFLYPNFRYEQVKFHQDHIHPYSKFSDSIMQELGISKDNQKKFVELRDTLPNLQILEGTENVKKNATHFLEWISSVNEDGRPTVPDIRKFKSDNYINEQIDLSFANFLNFYEVRKAKLFETLSNLLN